MATVKIAHIADIHLRDRQYCFYSRGEDFFNALKSAVEKAVENKVDAILCAGDLFNNGRPSSTTVGHRLCEIDAYLKKHNIPMLTSSGNHDINCCEWLEIFKENTTCGIIGLDDADYLVEDVRIHGIPYCSVEELKESMDNVAADVLMWHGEVTEFCGFKSGDSIGMAEFPENKFKLIAMGHIHKRDYKRRSSDGLVVAYPGSTEQCSQDEQTDKSFYLYTFENRELKDIQVVPIKTREVQEFKLVTELDVENCLTQIKPNSLVFVEYNRSLLNVIPRLNTVLGPDNILRQSFLPGEKEALDFTVDEDALEGPVQYVEKHIDDVVDKDTAKRIKKLTLACVDINADDRNCIDEFCEERLGTRVTL